MDNVPPAERLLMQRILELESEPLEVEEVDSDEPQSFEDDDDDDTSFEGRGDGGAGRHGGFTFDTSLASSHSYLGEVDNVACRRSFLDGGIILTLPMFYLEGVVLFPEETLPLRVIQPRFKAAVELAMKQEKAPCTIGVIHVHTRRRVDGLHFPLIGTTAEIRQFRHLDDGTINVVTRGQQRFRTKRAWITADGVPCAEVQIIPEVKCLHIPRDAFGMLASILNYESGKVPKAHQKVFDDQYATLSQEPEENSFENDEFDDGTASEEDEVDSEDNGMESDSSSQGGINILLNVSSYPGHIGHQTSWGGASRAWASDELKWRSRFQKTAWPHWVYRMFDVYALARRAADMWRQWMEFPDLFDMIKTPELLSYYIASKIPVSDETRQELLEMDSVVYRLQKEIRLLESLDCIRCKNCKNVIARRTDMLVMSSDGPMGAYVNGSGYVHETLTLRKADGLILQGRAESLHSWFPGYTWTIADCSTCESHMGWLFRAIKEDLRPRHFWGLRRSQLAEKGS